MSSPIPVSIEEYCQSVKQATFGWIQNQGEELMPFYSAPSYLSNWALTLSAYELTIIIHKNKSQKTHHFNCAKLSGTNKIGQLTVSDRNVKLIISLSQWYRVQNLLSNKCCSCCSTNVEQWTMWCWTLKYAVERCWTKIEHGSIPFNKLPLVERLQPIVFEFGVTWLRRNINMAAEELESAEFEWSFDNTCQLINLCLCDIGENFFSLKCPSFWVLPTGRRMLRILLYFLTIHASKFCGFFVFFVDASY